MAEQARQALQAMGLPPEAVALVMSLHEGSRVPAEPEVLALKVMAVVVGVYVRP